MTTNRIGPNVPSTTLTAEHPALPPTTHASRSPSRGPDVVVDNHRPTDAQQRLRAMQQRATATPTRAAEALSTNYNALVQSYRNQLLAGRTPSAPFAPPLPHMSGRDLIAHMNPARPDFGARVRSAEHASEHNRGEMLIEAAISHVLRPTFERMGLDHRVGSQFTANAASVVIHVLGDHIAEAGFGAVGSAAGAMLGAGSMILEFGDMMQSMVREQYRLAGGHDAPHAVVIEALQREVPVRAAQWARETSARLESHFSDGARQAASGQPADPARSHDQAYTLGYQRGSEYRRTNGATYEQVVQHNRALVEAQREAASMAPRAVVAPQHFVPVTQLEPDHVGVDIHLDP